jgi:hypothetical protein
VRQRGPIVGYLSFVTPDWVPTDIPVGTQVPASGLADFYY